MTTPPLDSIKSRIRKIHCLAQRGEEHEADTARRLLAKMLKKYDLTIDDIIHDHKKDAYYFSYRTKHEFALLKQIFGMVCNETRASYDQGERKSGVWFLLTLSQHVDIAEAYGYYRKNLKKEMDLFVQGFFQRYRLFPAPRDDDNSSSKMDDREREAILNFSGCMTSPGLAGGKKLLEANP